CIRRSAQRLIERCQREKPTPRKLQVCGIVERQLEAIREVERRGPGIGIGIGIDCDWHAGQLLEGIIAERCVDALAADRDLQPIGALAPPQGRYIGPLLGRLIEQRIRGGGAFILEIPAQRQRSIEDKAYNLPSSIRSLSFRPPSVTPLLIARILCAAARASSRLAPGRQGTSRATGLPRRVMVTSSPCSTQSSNWPSRFLASKAPISRMVASYIS